MAINLRARHSSGPEYSVEVDEMYKLLTNSGSIRGFGRLTITEHKGVVTITYLYSPRGM